MSGQALGGQIKEAVCPLFHCWQYQGHLNPWVTGHRAMPISSMLAFPGLYSSVGDRPGDLWPLFLSWLLQDQTEPVEPGRGRCSPIFHGFCRAGPSLVSHADEIVPPIYTVLSFDDGEASPPLPKQASIGSERSLGARHDFL